MCKGEIRPLDRRLVKTVTVSSESLEVVDRFCYLGDTISVDGEVKEVLSQILDRKSMGSCIL